MRYHTIGANEFADIIGADRSSVSHAVSEGRIRATSRGTNAKGPGSTMLSLNDAETIAAAVRCGVPWLVAAKMLDRIRPFKGGVIILEGVTFEEACRGQTTTVGQHAPKQERIHQA